MNKKTFMMIAVFVMAVFSTTAFAQQEEKPQTPKWVSEKGYWVVESNIHSPLEHIIRFYDNENQLLYKELVKGVKLNTEKRSVKMKLRKVLETNFSQWQAKKHSVENGDYVAAVLR